MKTTILEDINNFVADLVAMSLDRFFALIAVALFSLMVLVSVIAPTSPSKLLGMFGLLLTMIFTAFMAGVNYWINKINASFSNLDEERFEEDQNASDASHKDDFIA
jgi:hypothetical protein